MTAVHDEADPDDAQSCYALGRLDITFHTEKKGPPTIGMLVTDPHGRRIGFDPLSKAGWQELPQAQGFIDCDAPDGEGACRGTIQICGPVSGTYNLEIIAQQNAEYSVAISGRSAETHQADGLQSSNSQAEVDNIKIQKGARDILQLNYSRDPDSKIAVKSPTTPLASNE